MASGAAGNIWKATYDGRTVAAKELRAMSDLVGRDDALVELVNEVTLTMCIHIGSYSNCRQFLCNVR